MNNIRRIIQPFLAATVILSWLWFELFGPGIQSPTIELRILLLASLIWMFGDSVDRAVRLARGREVKEND